MIGVVSFLLIERIGPKVARVEEAWAVVAPARHLFTVGWQWWGAGPRGVQRACV